MRNKQDKKLNELFKSYIEEEAAPSLSVTDAATDVLRNAAAKNVAVANLATEEGSYPCGKAKSVNMRQWLAVSVVAALLIVLGCFFMFKDNSSDQDLSSGLSTVNYEMLTETEALSAGRFVPFAAEASVGAESFEVMEYKEYALKEDTDVFKKGEAVLYTAKYVLENETEAALFVEKNGICMEELSEYKNAEQSRQLGGNIIFFKLNGIEDYAYAYFQYGAYNYNLKLYLADEERLFEVVEEILQNLDDDGNASMTYHDECCTMPCFAVTCPSRV